MIERKGHKKLSFPLSKPYWVADKQGNGIKIEIDGRVILYLKKEQRLIGCIETINKNGKDLIIYYKDIDAEKHIFRKSCSIGFNECILRIIDLDYFIVNVEFKQFDKFITLKISKDEFQKYKLEKDNKIYLHFPEFETQIFVPIKNFSGGDKALEYYNRQKEIREPNG